MRNSGLEPYANGRKSSREENETSKKQTELHFNWNFEWKIWMIEAVVYLAVLLLATLVLVIWVRMRPKEMTEKIE